MRHIYAAITICTTASLGFGFAQQDIPADTSSALAAEWSRPASTLNCLRALRLYTTYTPVGNIVPLDPTDASTAALNELLTGTPPDSLPRVRDLYKVAHRRADFLDKLAKANALNTTGARGEALFVRAGNLIQAIYDVPDGKQNLDLVQASSAQKNYYLAIYQLLNAYPLSNPVGQPYADNLEILRACYKMNADRLFKLVSDKILGAN